MVADDLVTVREAAMITGLSERSVNLMCTEGKIPAQRIGKQFVISASWAEAERVKRTPPDGYITVREARVIAGVSRQRMHQLIKVGLVKSVSRPIFAKRLVWVDTVSLEQWMRETRS